MPMRILMINSVCGIRSTGRICTDLAAALEEQGHEVKIAYGREIVPEQFQKYSVRIGSNYSIYLHGLKARLFDASGFGSKYATRQFIKWIREFDPDIIHLHNIHGYYINIQILFDYLKESGKKIIWTLHDCWAFTGHCSYFDLANCDRWKNGCESCPNKKKYPKSIIDRSYFNWNKKNKLFSNVPNLSIVTPSEWLAALIKQSFLSEYNVTVIHNGIDTNIFKPINNDFKSMYNLHYKTIISIILPDGFCERCLTSIINIKNKLSDKYNLILIGAGANYSLFNFPSDIIFIKTSSNKMITNICCESDIVLAQIIDQDTVFYKTENKMLNTLFCEESVVRKIVNIQNNNSLDTACTKLGYFSFRNKYCSSDKKIILAVSAFWGNNKGINDFFMLRNLLPEDKYLLIIVGLNKEQETKIKGSIISIRRTNDVQELRMLYSIADYFVNPTYEDNYPTVNLEAISCGTPVISYNTGGSSESTKLFGEVVKRGGVCDIANVIINNKNFHPPKEKSLTKGEMLSLYMPIYNQKVIK